MKKNIVLLSGVDTSDNYKALSYIKYSYPKFKKVCFIPAQKEGSESEYKQITKDFKNKLKYKEVFYTPLEDYSSKDIKDRVESSDVLFLGGGNTFSFFEMIQKKRLASTFKKHLSLGKVIVGLSAGAIVLTPSLLMACYPSKDADEFCADLKDMNGLGFTNFEVCPHYRNSSKMKKEISTYSALHRYPVYGIKDGEFIAVGDKGAFFSGETVLFYRGEKL
jgi:dipeptidase E